MAELLRLFYGEAETLSDCHLRAGTDDVRIESRIAAGQVSTRLSLDDAREAQDWSEPLPASGRLVRRALRRQLYHALSAATGHAFPWGSLTGIRPSYLVHEARLAGLRSPAIVDELMTRYGVSRAKAILAVRAEAAEEAILDDYPSTDLALYLHIPYCPSRCSYCSFALPEAIARPTSEHSAYVDALIAELETVLGHPRWREAMARTAASGALHRRRHPDLPRHGAARAPAGGPRRPRTALRRRL